MNIPSPGLTDDAGNITSHSEYAFTTGELGTATKTVNYTYGDSSWSDLLTAYDGNSITYDGIGNPTSYYNGTRWTFTWEHGRNLATATDGTTSISYTYDGNGMRATKTVDGVVHTYYYAGDKLMRYTVGDTTLDFSYDQNGQPYSVNYNGLELYYVLNLQDDVIRMLDANGKSYGVYCYDAWGNIIYQSSTQYITTNPLRYRGYVFDEETGLYYCQSRYYDPQMGRFINADAYTSTGQGLLGNNMFAYCRNNPVRRIDISGSADADCINNDGEVMSSDELEDHGGGGGGPSGSWSMFLQCLDDAASGLEAAMGKKTYFSSERHHIFSNKCSKFTPQYKEITDRYNYSLNQQENIIELQGHKGRHTNAYHEFMMTSLKALDAYASGNSAAFYDGMRAIAKFLEDNPWLPYARKGGK